MNYDPELRAAIEEISKIYKKYDCGGFVSLVSATHGEFKNFIDSPSWSNIRFLKEGKAAHIKIHMKSDPKNTEATAHLLCSLRDTAVMAFQSADELLKNIEA